MEKAIRVIQEKLSDFQDLYTHIRIVDPATKRTIQPKDAEPSIEPGYCYSFWQKNAQCANCVTMKANIERRSFVKIEFKEDKIYIVQAVPTILDGEQVIIELLKDITEIGIFIGDYKNSVTEVQDIIRTLNEKLLLDDLTGIYNRRFIDTRLPADLLNCESLGLPLSVAIIDVDHFKQVNDTYGHSVGDQLLRELSQLIAESIRSHEDWIARYGGEEFLLVLKKIGRDHTILALEKLRRKIEEHVFCPEKHKIRITCSFGARVIYNELLSNDDIIEQVDKCLYEAKRTGRNKVVI